MDIQIENHGTIVLLRPLTARGRTWLGEHIAEDAQQWAGAVVAEPRYVDAIAEGAIGDGLEVA